MNKMFKISVITASLLVSGILVGCGGSSEVNVIGGSETNATQPTKPEVKTTDATVRSLAGKIVGAQLYFAPKLKTESRAAKVNNKTKEDEEKEKAKYLVGDNAKIVFKTEIAGVKLEKDGKKLTYFKVESSDNGTFKFAEPIEGTKIIVDDGYIDVDNSGNFNTDDIKVLPYVVEAGTKNINVLTTLKTLVGEDKFNRFNMYAQGIEADVDISTITDKKQLVVALLATLILKEANQQNVTSGVEYSTAAISAYDKFATKLMPKVIGNKMATEDTIIEIYGDDYKALKEADLTNEKVKELIKSALPTKE